MLGVFLAPLFDGKTGHWALIATKSNGHVKLLGTKPSVLNFYSLFGKILKWVNMLKFYYGSMWQQSLSILEGKKVANSEIHGIDVGVYICHHAFQVAHGKIDTFHNDGEQEAMRKQLGKCILDGTLDSLNAIHRQDNDDQPIFPLLDEVTNIGGPFVNEE